MKIKVLFLITAMALINAIAFSKNTASVIFQKGENGFDTYRIPALVQTNSGTLLAFAEARKNGGSDTGDIDLVLKRSIDNGKTWSDIITIWDEQENVCGNPCPIVVSETGRIILLSTWNHGRDHKKEINERTSIDTRRVFLMYSDDDGITWSCPQDITSKAKLPEWTWYATGPCHGIETSTGRLIAPCNHGIFGRQAPAETVSHVIISDDQGMNWRIGGSADTGNESTVTELSNGDIMLNMRGYRDPERIEKNNAVRLVAISHDGGENFKKSYYEKGLIEPVCNGSIISYNHHKYKGILLFSNPESMDTRENMTIKISSDDGKTWKRLYSVHKGPAAYSDLAVLHNGDICILYECGTDNRYETISFMRIDKKVIRRKLLYKK